MSFLVSNVRFFGLAGKTVFFRSPIFKLADKTANITNRSISSQFFGGAPSQLPTEGEPGWQGFLANAKRVKAQPPLSGERIAQIQANYNLNKQLAQIQELVAKNIESNQEVIRSNQEFSKKVQYLIEKLHTQ